MIKINDKTISSVFSGEKVIEKIFKGTLKVYEGWKNLIANGVPPLTLLKCKGVDLVDYKIYGNSVQDGTPTPDTPIEIESVGDKTKNLLNYEGKFASYYVGLTNKLNSDGTITSVGIPLTTYAVIVPYQNINDLLDDGETYIISQKLYSLPIYVQVRATNISTGTSSYYTAQYKATTFKVDKSTYTYEFNIQAVLSQWGSESRTITNGYQLEKGNTATEFGPYGYKIPVKVRGKNLFDYTDIIGKSVSLGGATISVGADGGISASGIPTEYISITTIIKPELSGITTFSISGEFSYISCQISILDAKNNTLLDKTIKDGDNQINIDMGDYPLYDKIRMDIKRRANNVEMSGTAYIQIEEGSTATEYEPYIEPVITNIYLDEPLRKAGNYADYIDFKNKKVVRNVKSITLNGQEYWYKPWGERDDFSYAMSVTDIYDEKSYQSVFKGYCNEYSNSTHSDLYNQRKNYSITSQVEYLSIIVRDISIPTLEEFKQKLADKYNSGNPIIIDYLLATPIEETIKLPNIPTIKGTTIIEVDTEIQPSNMEVTYKGKGE